VGGFLKKTKGSDLKKSRDFLWDIGQTRERKNETVKGARERDNEAWANCGVISPLLLTKRPKSKSGIPWLKLSTKKSSTTYVYRRRECFSLGSPRFKNEASKMGGDSGRGKWNNSEREF